MQLNQARLLSAETLEQIFEAIESVGSDEALTPIYETLDGEVDYNRLQIGRAYYRQAQK